MLVFATPKCDFIATPKCDSVRGRPNLRLVAFLVRSAAMLQTSIWCREELTNLHGSLVRVTICGRAAAYCGGGQVSGNYAPRPVVCAHFRCYLTARQADSTWCVVDVTVSRVRFGDPMAGGVVLELSSGAMNSAPSQLGIVSLLRVETPGDLCVSSDRY